jgi:hypothetical protein
MKFFHRRTYPAEFALRLAGPPCYAAKDIGKDTGTPVNF